jgi:Phosphotransferase enzyme family
VSPAALDRPAAEEWIHSHVETAGSIETAHERPWATVLRVPLADGVAWFKACADVQRFEARLTAWLAARWPNLLAEVISTDLERGWLLLADAGAPVGAHDHQPEVWLEVLGPYAELQRGEIAYAGDHLAHGVPDLRLEVLPDRYADLLRHDLPIDEHEIEHLRVFAPRFAELCADLASCGIAPSVQHDDLHGGNLYADGDTLRVLDWGDSSIAHPFMSLVVPFRFLAGVHKIPPGDPWYTRVRDAYLEPWGSGLEDACALAVRLGWFAHACAWTRQRDFLPEAERREFDVWYPEVLRLAVAETRD